MVSRVVTLLKSVQDLVPLNIFPERGSGDTDGMLEDCDSGISGKISYFPILVRS